MHAKSSIRPHASLALAEISTLIDQRPSSQQSVRVQASRPIPEQTRHCSRLCEYLTDAGMGFWPGLARRLHGFGPLSPFPARCNPRATGGEKP